MPSLPEALLVMTLSNGRVEMSKTHCVNGGILRILQGQVGVR
jgi:hypothetical protein